MSDSSSGLVSGEGEKWIFPVHFFDIIGQLRKDAVLDTELSALAVPDVASDTGGTYLEALVNSITEARTMLAANLEIAGRALLVAGTRVIDADMVEEGVDSFWGLSDGPWERIDDESQRDEQGELMDAYYDDLNAYTAPDDDGD